MLKPLMNKEIKLALHETNIIFFFMAFMLFIPSYPFYVAFFFPCLGIFYLFLNGREQNDIYFSALLPVRKKDIVKARFVTVTSIQIIQVLLSVPIAFLRNKIFTTSNEAGIEVNVAFYGLILVMYAIFNMIFLPAFYKTAYKLGVPFIVAGIAQFAFIVLTEGLVLAIKPIGLFLDTVDTGMMIKQIPVLLTGILVYMAVVWGSFKISAKSFEKLDL